MTKTEHGRLSLEDPPVDVGESEHETETPRGSTPVVEVVYGKRGTESVTGEEGASRGHPEDSWTR